MCLPLSFSHLRSLKWGIFLCAFSEFVFIWHDYTVFADGIVAILWLSLLILLLLSVHSQRNLILALHCTNAFHNVYFFPVVFFSLVSVVCSIFLYEIYSGCHFVWVVGILAFDFFSCFSRVFPCSSSFYIRIWMCNQVWFYCCSFCCCLERFIDGFIYCILNLVARSTLLSLSLLLLVLSLFNLFILTASSYHLLWYV